jgi:murein DD-endopeptidase MepM/ murein hydrolase activator NlpD
MELRNSVRLSAVLVALTAVNIYVFFFRDDTSVKKLMQPSSTGKALVEEKKLPAAALPTKPGAELLPPAGTAPAVAGPETRPGEAAEGRVVEGTIGDKDTLFEVISRESLGQAAPAVLRALSRLIDPKSIRPGDRYSVSFDAEGAPTSFEYLPSPVLRYIVSPVAQSPDGSWTGRKEEKPLTVRAVETGGVVESSLYESVSKAKEQGALVSQLVDIFAWDINFYIDTHPGDHWKVVVEKHYLNDQFYRYGNILAAEYGGRVGTFRAFAWSPPGARGGPVRYYDEKGQANAYDEKGQAIAKSFLKTPLRFVKVSSKFDPKRFHPILHQTKAHLGVDYAAPSGTPVWASASGRVVECGKKSGSGNTVVIAHGNGLATRYYHLSRFAAGMKVGRQLRQKELIGYVGSTGLSTGPHLHFAVTKNGTFVDPTKMQAVRESGVADKAGFLAAIKPRLAALRNAPPAVANRN